MAPELEFQWGQRVGGAQTLLFKMFTDVPDSQLGLETIALVT